MRACNPRGRGAPPPLSLPSPFLCRALFVRLPHAAAVTGWLPCKLRHRPVFGAGLFPETADASWVPSAPLMRSRPGQSASICRAGSACVTGRCSTGLSSGWGTTPPPPSAALNRMSARTGCRSHSRAPRCRPQSGLAEADQHHADHQLGIDRWTPGCAVVGLKAAAKARQLDEAVDRAQQVIGRDMIFEAEPVEQRVLPHRPLAHHAHALATHED